MKKLSIIYLSAISIGLFGCEKGPIAELGGKGLKKTNCTGTNGCFLRW